MVVQRDQPVVLWGWADAGEAVSVAFDGETQSTQANDAGRWRVALSPRKTGGPFELVVKGNNTLTLENVLVGDVWLCSGQSNMEMQFANVHFDESEFDRPELANIRLFELPRTKAVEPQDDCPSRWTLCTREHIEKFSAVGYFFGRHLQPEIGVPLGLVHSSHGGSPAEAWVRWETLEQIPEMKPLVNEARDADQAWTGGSLMADYDKRMQQWHDANIDVSLAKSESKTFIDGKETREISYKREPWTSSDADLVGVGVNNILLTECGLGAGDFAIHAELSLDRVMESSAYFILGNSHFGFSESTWGRFFERGQVFGESTALVGRTDEFIRDGEPFSLDIKRQGSALSVLINDKPINTAECGSGTIGALGFCPGKRTMTVRNFNATGNFVTPPPATVAFAQPVKPVDPRLSHRHPSTLFNGMIEPLLPMRLRGVIWYQGESNHERAVQYRALFPALIESWRAEWKQPELPFLFVQLASFLKAEPEPSESDWAELREAQRMSLRVPHTAMAVAIDVGEADDIHPKNKEPVGERLARAARALVYGAKVTYSGPIYRDMKVEDSSIRLSFDHIGSGLVARGGPLKQFAIAGADQKFHWAAATIEGDTIVVSTPEVTSPVAVRYAWASNPEGCNLYNKEGLPASPFRTDDWPLLSDGKRTVK
ncbi:MAG: hypothetical protein H6817_04865 [Phycisphaerales bacterium]|nr:hypothetical protein [Phycisphaerales bacterium]